MTGFCRQDGSLLAGRDDDILKPISNTVPKSARYVDDFKMNFYSDSIYRVFIFDQYLLVFYYCYLI